MDKLKMTHRFNEIAATWFYLGKFPKAPGTVGTLGAIPLVWLLFQAGPLMYMFVTVLLVLAAVFISDAYDIQLGGHDSKEIVIDEVVGFLITMVWMPMTWQAFVVGFILFRLFDILKPYPISYLDKKVKGGLGVVIDDVAAGLVASFIMQALYSKTALLGFQNPIYM